MDGDFAKQQRFILEADLALARPVTYEDWKNRPFTEKMGERFSALLRSQL